MKYAGIIKNDLAAGPGVCVTFFAQGCDKHCKGCHNPETWDFEGGKEFTVETMNTILSALTANGVSRNLAIMGGEPLHPNNVFLTYMIMATVKEHYPDTKIYLWSGYTYDEIKKMNSPYVSQIIKLIDILVDGPYIEELRDITLPMRGSKNQCIITDFS